MLHLPINDGTNSKPSGRGEYPLQLKGRCRTFVASLPADALEDFSDESKSQFFVYAWMDSVRGCGAHVHYASVKVSSNNVGASVGAEVAEPVAAEHFGDFTLSLNIHEEDLDLVKVMCCVRIRDEETGNTRISVVSSGALRLSHLLMGAEEKVTLQSVFDRGNRSELCVSAMNAADFANLSMSISPTGGLHLPLIRFKPSSLWRLPEIHDHLQETCDTLKLEMDKFKIEPPFRADNYVAGLTRWLWRPSFCPHLPCSVLALSLCLGTPAYTLISSCVPAGNSPGRHSTTAHKTSPPS